MEWIKIENELPKEGVFVLITTTKYNKTNIDLAYLDNANTNHASFVLTSDQHDIKYITHWMALPSLPND